jgi:2,4-dienoyl-CoA reductase-like NADH-dependent reductase (Old Yellow Enzyme family)
MGIPPFVQDISICRFERHTCAGVDGMSGDGASGGRRRKTVKLSEPIEIRGMTLKNRLGFAPFLNMPQAEDGGVSDLTIRWFETRAQGGVGFIMTGAVRPTHLTDESFLANAGLALNEDKFVPGFRRLADAIHAHGTRLGVQIAVLGPLGGLGMSPLPYPDERHAADRTSDVLGRDIPIRVLSAEEIERLEDDIAVAAVRAKAAGIDCVELHCAHGGATLHCSSISPFYNRRTDRYGGDWEGRLRFPVNTIRKIREAVGDDYPIIVRIDADELLGERGIQVGDATGFIVPALEAAGADCIDVSQGSILHTPEGITIPLYYPRGCFIHHAAAVKQATSLPVIGVGNIFDLDMAEKFLQEGKADIIYPWVGAAGRAPSTTTFRTSPFRSFRRSGPRGSSWWAAALPAWRPPGLPRRAATK